MPLAGRNELTPGVPRITPATGLDAPPMLASTQACAPFGNTPPAIRAATPPDMPINNGSPLTSGGTHSP